MNIDYLANHMHFAPLLARWHTEEWKDLLPDWTYDEALAELRTHTGRCQIPTTVVAIEHDKPVGSASLIETDLDGWKHLTPWIASVYVVPHRRNRGIGRALIARLVDDAISLKTPVLYLFTTGLERYYRRMGWMALVDFEHHGHRVTIMERKLPTHAPAQRG